MVVERRAFSRLPEYLQTDQNNRDMYISDDTMFEPERAGFLSGYIGDVSLLTEEDLRRQPLIQEDNPIRQKNQLSLAVVQVDPVTDDRSGGAFYTDLVNQIRANGGNVTDENTLFETTFYAWSPPFDYDKHINYTRYYWTGAGNAQVNGEYITREPVGSTTRVYKLTGSGFTSVPVTIAVVAPVGPVLDDLWEDVSNPNRIIKRWDGATWVALDYTVQPIIPSTAGYATGDYVYVTRTGPAFNRPLIWKYSFDAGRWLSNPVVIGPAPDSPVEGMVWEDSRLVPNRTLQIYRNGAFVPLTWTASNNPSGTPTSELYVLDTRPVTDGDGWSQNNWWRHYGDLSPADREALVSGDQAIRPIIEFWAGIEMASGSARVARHDLPKFRVYKAQPSGTIVATNNSTTLFQYQVGVGIDDSVMEFPLVFNQTGEFQFQLTLESDTFSDIVGYRYFKDTMTGLTHSIWAKSDTPTVQNLDQNSVIDPPKNLTSNADHEILKVASRSQMLNHISAVIRNQIGFAGNQFGSNNYRWTDKAPTTGATLIDCENSLLRVMGTLQRPELDIPDAIRRIARDYNRVLFKFITRMTQLWDNLTISEPGGTLIVSASQAVDLILSELFIGKNEQFPFFYSDMGTYTETQIVAGTITVIGTAPTPIFIPPSAPRVGASPTYRPEMFTDRDGTKRLRGHEGVVLPAFEDDRDLIWLEFQNRLFNAVPSYYRDETATFSARHVTSNFSLADYYGNASPNIVEVVQYIVTDFSLVVSPTVGDLAIDTGKAQYGYWDGFRFNTRPMLVDDVVFNAADGEYYIYNGFGVFRIDLFNRPGTFPYPQDTYRTILRREFERWAVSQNVDFISNNDYSASDRFTWNYRSAGVEGNYRGIYSRLYRTIRPHSHPWEIVGYALRPDWWLTSYVPTSTAADGTPRYANTHPMWADLQAGIFNPLTGRQSNLHVMVAPIPVDAAGELLDPIAAGIVNEDHLVPERRDDSWVYGDGAPVEQDFISSPYFSFATALLGYLMKPGRYVDTLWSELYVDIGVDGANPVWRAPHVVHRDLLTRPRLKDLPQHLEEVDGTVNRQLGVNAWVSEYVRSLGGNITTIFGNTIRNSQVSLAWKCAGFVNSDRTNIQTLSGVSVPFEDLHTILHRSKPISEFFASGVLVTREGTGYRVFGFDLFNPSFSIETPVAPIAGGQIELNEDFVATAGQHVFTVTEFKLPRSGVATDTATLSVLVNGLKLRPQHVAVSDNTITIEEIVTINAGDVIGINILTVQSSPSTRVKQFVVDGVAFPYIDSGRGVYEDIEYGRYFDTAPDVINFMLGYGRKLTNDGWKFEEEIVPGVMRDWLYGAKSFATWVVETTRAKTQDIEDFYYSPFSDKAVFESEFGQVINIESVQNGAFGILDREANPIDPELILTSRIGNQISLIKSETSPDLYGVRVLVVEDQHVVFFSNITKFNDLLYDPVLAMAQPTMRLDGYRTTDWAGRLDANGFIISQGRLLPNLEKQAKDFTRYYDRIDTLDDPVKRDQARELYGWYPNAIFTDTKGDKTLMMDAINANERSQFDYHRGMIHTKGTIRPIIAFSRGTRMGRDNVIVNQDWAWRWCDFGDTRRELVQFRVNKTDFRDRLQVVEFNSANDIYDTILQIPKFNRATPNTGRWIVPPVQGRYGTEVDYTLPINLDGSFDEETRMFVKLFNADTNNVASRLFHFNPYVGSRLYDPEALCHLDYISFYDPARYTDGDGAAYSDNQQWGPDQVGKLWWDQTRLSYMDAVSYIPDYNLAARMWGKLTYFTATVTRTNNVVTVNTTDPVTGLPAPHNLQTGDSILITGADQDSYNGEWVVDVFNATQLTFQISVVPDSPATGNIRIVTSFVDVYEWIESPVQPSGWATYVAGNSAPGAPTGTPKDGVNTSFVTRAGYDDRNNKKVYYYFWIIKNTGDNPAKEITTSSVVSRLENPTINNVPWFAVLDESHLITFVNGEQVNDGYALEIIQDRRELDNHSEWLLISEGSRFLTIPDVITDKLIDSLTGVDEFGNPVPNPMLSDSEKYGSDAFPQQTVFVDRVKALKVFNDTANAIMARRNYTSTINLINTFPLADENVWWKRAEHRALAYEGKAVFDRVANATIRDDRLVKKRYYEGDLVQVLTTANSDPWSNTPVSSTYVVQDGGFVEVGVDKATMALTVDANTTPANIRKAFAAVLSIMEKEERNDVVFALLYEMMHQHPNADWFIKTSYITMQMFSTIGQSPFVRPNEQAAVIADTLDTKPYRTKLRTSTFTYSVDTIENMAMQIDEFPDIKVTLLFDRLSCDGTEDGGWDGYPWDTEPEGWDKPFWTWADQGLSETFSVGVLTGVTGQIDYTFTPPYDPTLYSHSIVLRRSGEEVLPADIGLAFTLVITHRSVTVRFNAPLADVFTVELLQTGGFYEGSTPSLGPDFEDTLFQPYASSYQHHVMRMMGSGTQAPFPSMPECEVEFQIGEIPGGFESDPIPIFRSLSPEERIPSDVEDSVVICVKNDHTQAYAGWDTTPWDVTPWDIVPFNNGRRVFFIMAGGEEIIPPGNRVLPTSLSTTISTETRFLRSDARNRVGQVLLNGDVLTEGLQYRRVPQTPWVLEFPVPQDIIYSADGISNQFDVSDALYGVSQVFKNNVPQVNGVQYFVSGNEVVFVQPPPTLIPIYSTPIARYTSANSIQTVFPTGHPGGGVVPQNVFAFLNGDLVDQADYTVNPADDVVMATAPAYTDDFITFAIGNSIGDNDPIFNIFDFVGDGTTVTYVVGTNATDPATWIFVNNRYQVLGVDYTIPVIGTIQFTTAPILGDAIHIRILDSTTFISQDIQHVVITASGGVSDAITGLNNSDPSNMMVFLGDEIQNGYSGLITDYTLTDGVPDVINWVTPPAPGTPISFRIFRSVQVDTIPLVTVNPSVGDRIRIVPRHTLVPGDVVDVLYDQFPVGPLNGFRVVSAPSAHDIVNGVLTLATPTLGSSITLNYNKAVKGPNRSSILVRMTEIVDRALEDHTTYDGATGLEVNRYVGLRILNTTDHQVYEWTGTAWTPVGLVLLAGTKVLSLLDQKIIERVGAAWNTVFNTGDTYTAPPVLTFPPFGRGITSATYAMSLAPSAAVDFPAAYQVMQHPGDYW